MKLSLALAALPIMSTSAYNIGGVPLFYRTTSWPMVRRAPSVFDSVSPFGLSLMEDRLQRRNELFRRQVDQLNRAFDMAGRDMDSSLSMPSFRVLSDDASSVVSVDVPGIAMKDIDISIDDDQRLMTISGKREINKDGAQSYTKFSRTFQIDERARLDELRATLENGVLTVQAPKEPVVEDEAVEESKIRRIPIEAAESSEADQASEGSLEEEAVKTETESTAEAEEQSDKNDSEETLDLDAVPEKVEAEKESVSA